MSLTKQAGMVKKLAQLTKEGLIDWKSSLNQSSFQVSFRDNTIRITTRDRGDEVDILIQLLNGNGEIVEIFSDVDLGNISTESGQTWFNLMQELLENARRKALGADKVLDEIIADLDKADDIPF
jgi:hypothetical protein